MKRSLLPYLLACATAAELFVSGCKGDAQAVRDGTLQGLRRGEMKAGEERQSYATVMATLAELRTGLTEGDTAKLLERSFVRGGTNNFLSRFSGLVPYADPACVSEWQSRWVEPDGWPQVVFAVFGDANKTNLVDALWCENGGVEPVVDGFYNRHLRSLKAGDSVELLYAYLGYRNCRYFLAPGGRWRVTFSYRAFPGRVFVVEADAADGRITYVGDGTL